MAKLIAFFLALQMFFAALSGGVQSARTVSQNEYAGAGFSLTRTLIGDCYNVLTHKLDHSTDSSGMPYVWPAASFVEMLSDAYRLFPGSAKIKTVYRDALVNLFPQYLAENQTLHTTSGDVDGISYYNSYAGGSGSYYYDDNQWVCIQLLLGYQNLGDQSLLQAAEKNLEFMWTGWDNAAGGGIYWYMDYRSKNACSNAPGAIACLLAYQLTGKKIYLDRGKMIFDWMNRTMRQDDLFADNVDLNGAVANPWKGTYNQATMIYAGALLYEITGEQTYFDLTKATVDATLRYLFETADGPDGKTVTMRANPIFKAWCVGWLTRAYVKFYEVDPAKDDMPMRYVTEVMAAELATKDENGLYDPFFCSGGSDPANYTDLLSQCGVACALLNTALFDAGLR